MTRPGLPPATRILLCCLCIFTFIEWSLSYSKYLVAASRYEMSLSREDSSKTDYSASNAPNINDFAVTWLVLVANSSSSLLSPWVFITASFVEQHIVTLVLSLGINLYGSKHFEHIWGTKELLRFTGIAVLIPNILIYIWCMFMFHQPRTTTDDVTVKPIIVNGGISIISAYLVAFKQIMPEHLVVLFNGFIKFRVKRLPCLHITTAIFLGILGFHIYCSLALLGFFSSWIYLRFFRVNYADPVLPFNSSGNKSTISFTHFNSSSTIKITGDASDSFALSQFFPEPFSFLVEWISDKVSRIMITLRIMKPFSYQEIESANARANSRRSSLGGSLSFINTRNNKGQTGKFKAFPGKSDTESHTSFTLRALENKSILQPPSAAVLPAPRAG